MLLQAMADQFGLPVTEYAGDGLRAELSSEVQLRLRRLPRHGSGQLPEGGFATQGGAARRAGSQVLPKNIWQYVVGIPRLASLGTRFVLQGGTQYNLAALKAQVDYILERVPEGEVFVHPHTGEAGAIGAAMETLRVVSRRGQSRFIGLDAAIALEYQARNDETTRCHFCANDCSRTFIDAHRPDGSTSRYISGFSCEKGMVESKQAMVQLVKERKRVMKQFPNLVTHEGRAAFQHVGGQQTMPEAGAPKQDVRPKKTFWGQLEYEKYSRPFERSSAAATERRKKMAHLRERLADLETTLSALEAEDAETGGDVRKPAVRKAAARKPAARKPAARKPAARKPAARKAATRKPATRKPATRKAGRRSATTGKSS